MADLSGSKNSDREEPVEKPDLSCSCVQDPFASLPPELRPTPEPKKGGLRQATCPACGMKFWTNRSTDYCLDCEKKGLGKAR